MAELAALNVRISGDSGGLVAAINSAEGSLTSFGRVTTAAEAKSRGFDSALRRAGGSATSLQNQINALTGVMNRSSRSAEVSARAFDSLGDEALQSAAQMAAAARQAQSYGTQATGASLNTANLAAQFNDIGVMLAAGQSPLMLALQQGTQINQVFGQMGAGANRLSVLGAALRSVISPANLVTIGIIAGGAAIVQFGMNALGAGEEVQTLEDKLSALKDMQEALDGSTEILSMSVEELSEKYGSAAYQVKEFAQAQAQSAIATARNALKEQLLALDDVIDRYSVATLGFNEFGEAIQTADPFINLRKDLGLVDRDLYEVFDAFTNLKAAMSFEEQQAALLQLDRALVDAGVSAGELPPELNRALYEMRELVFQANELEASVMKAQGAVSNMTFGVPLLGLSDSQLLPPMPTPEDPTGDREAAAKRLQAELDEVRNSLLTQEEAQIASYERQQETLQTALDQRLITQQEYNALLEDAQKQHSDKMAEIDAYRYGSGLQQAQAFFGDMATAMAGGNDKMLKMSRTFGAAEALINAWRAYSQTIADPTLPFFAKIPAAISVLAAGMRAVSSIQSGSRGSAGGASSASAVAPSAAQASPGVSRNVAIQLTGGDMFSRSQVVQLINSINEAVEDGAVVRLV